MMTLTDKAVELTLFESSRAFDGRLPSIIVNTEDVPRQHRTEAYVDYLNSGFHDMKTPDSCRAASARFESWKLGDALVIDGRSSDIQLSRTARHVARDGLDYWSLRVARAGRFVSLSKDQCYVMQPGDVAIETLCEPYRDHWFSAEWVSIFVRRESDLGRAFTAHERRLGLLSGATAGLLGDYLAALPNRLREARESDAASFADATRGMIRACLAKAAGEDASPEDFNRIARERVLRVIERHLGSARLDPERISQLAQVSRSSLYRMFEDHGGVARYVQKRRLVQVLEDLADPAQDALTIAMIAERHGFHNTSAFNRLFRRINGCTPGEARRAAQLGLRHPAQDRAVLRSARTQQ